MTDEFNLSCPIPLGNHATVQMAHGSGGRLMRQLIEEMFLPAFQLGPAAVQALVMTGMFIAIP